VESAKPDGDYLVRRQPEASGSSEIDANRRRIENLQLGVERDAEQVFDRAEGPPVFAHIISSKRAAAGHPVDNPLGNKVLKGTADGLAADAEGASELGLGRQPLSSRVLLVLDLLAELVGEHGVSRHALGPFNC
jgi:hypothetical protein